MSALGLEIPAAELHTGGGLDVQECRRGEFYADDFGLVSAPPRLSIAAALVGTTVAGIALAVYAISEIAGRYAARPRSA